MYFRTGKESAGVFTAVGNKLFCSHHIVDNVLIVAPDGDDLEYVTRKLQD
jgi:hypothetical protein